jgi:16S rRNA (uracil1498-N3)-methyltransferase
VNARFHAPDARTTGDVVRLPDDEAQHLALVLRLRNGATIRVFDGRGHEFDATVESADKSGVTARIGAAVESTPEPRIAITLAQAVLKGDKMDDVVRDAVMMGVSVIQPIVTARAELGLSALRRGARVHRWHRIAVSSAKQCGRAVVPAILEPIALDDLFAAITHTTLPAPAIMLVEPGAAPDAARLAELVTDVPREATVVIGPEGGWTPEEIARGSSSCRLVTLGGRTLRADAMAVVALSVLFAVWREF